MDKAELHEVDTRRRRRRHHRLLFRLLILLLVLAVVALTAAHWDALAPDVLIGKIGALLSGETAGGFPVNVTGNRISQLETADGCTVLLSDTYVTMINSNGAEVMRRAHAYSQPLLRTAGKYVLVAEGGGRRLQLETREKTVQNLTLEYDILTVSVHKNGSVAVVTAAEQGYNATVSVYTAAGRLAYRRLCASLVADVAFSPNGKQLAMITVGAEGGAMRSAVEVVSLRDAQSETLYAHSESDVLLCRLQYLSDAVITAIGDTAVWMYYPKKDDCHICPLAAGDLIAFAVGENSVVAVTRPYGSAADGSITYIQRDGAAAFTAASEGVCRDIAVSGNSYTLLTGAYIYQIGSKGITGSLMLSETGRLVSAQGSRVVVLGLQNLSQYAAPSRLNVTN